MYNSSGDHEGRILAMLKKVFGEGYEFFQILFLFQTANNLTKARRTTT